MFRRPARFSRGVIAGALAVSLTAAAAVAGTIHSFASSQTTGSEGAYDFLQTGIGGALQGEVGSAASTAFGTPFGVFGKYGPPSSTTTKGLGLVGISTNGWGVTGENIGYGPALYAFPNSKDGEGLDAESDNREAIYGESHAFYGDGADLTADDHGYGVDAYSAYGTGMYAEGGDGDGLDAYSDDNTNGVFGQSYGGYGVQGYSSTTDGVHADIDNGNSGVAGINEGGGNGVYAQSLNGFGMNAENEATPSPIPTGGPYQYAAAYGQSVSGPGTYGVNTHTGAGAYTVYNRYPGAAGYSTDGPGVYGYSQLESGVIAESSGFNSALYVVNNESMGKSDEIDAGSGSTPTNGGGGGNVNFAVDSSGNAYLAGKVTSNDGSLAVTRNPRSDAVTYGAESTEPMVEDVGIAHLVNGAAAVAIDGAFRQTIAESSRYMVFITPEGDSNGLYITQKSPAGFIVREARGGRSTMDFDYKIVAQRYGVQTGRLPHLAAISPRMAQIRADELHRNTNGASTNAMLKYAIVAPPVKEGSKRAALLAQARHAAAAAHRRMTRPPTPPPGFLAGIRN